MDTVYTALVFPLLLLIGQTLVALGQRKLNQRMDEGQAKTDAKREAEAEWREHVVTHSQDAVTMTPDLDACGPGVFSYDTSTTITSQ